MKVLPVIAPPDNFMYIIIDDQKTKDSAVIDPRDANLLKNAINNYGNDNINIKNVFVTHHHMDHSAEAYKIPQIYGNDVKIYGNDKERIKGQNVQTTHEGTFKLGNLTVQTFHTPGHTNSHCCYYITDPETNEKVVFTGDTLFIAGCGRLFEGTPEQMDESLNKILGSLPNDTKVYVGHEYTVANLQFAQSVEPTNTAVSRKLSWALQKKDAKEWTIPSTIVDEKSFNPFMRVRESTLQKLTGKTDPVEVLKIIREMKDNFVPQKL